jgi:hypothetical protein
LISVVDDWVNPVIWFNPGFLCCGFDGISQSVQVVVSRKIRTRSKFALEEFLLAGDVINSGPAFRTALTQLSKAVNQVNPVEVFSGTLLALVTVICSLH